MPSLIPIEQLGVLLESIGKVRQAKAFQDGIIGNICLCDESFRRVEILFLLLVDGDLGLTDIIGIRILMLTHRILLVRQVSRPARLSTLGPGGSIGEAASLYRRSQV